MHTSHHRLAIIFLVSLSMALSCSGSGKSKKDKKSMVITAGDSVTVKTDTIDAQGGTITVSASEDETLNGLSIEIPEGAFGESQTLSISYRTIEDHNLSDDAQMLTPLISISNGDTRSDDFISVTLPVDAPDDYQAMAFYYDEAGNRLEGMTGISSEENGIAFMTRHFSEFVAVALPKAILSSFIDTGFKPGVDDWQFRNLGSWAAPRGHCAGQSIMALYYYTEKKLKEGAPQLYGLYDNDGNIYDKTPDLHFDDVLAYKLCSVAQNDLSANVDIDGLSWYDKQHNSLDTLNIFSQTMLISGEPQFVAIYRTNSSGNKEGHAMVAYKEGRRTNDQGEEEGVLYVADPNYPTEEREIVYSFEKGAFTPYKSGPKADETGMTYPEIYFKEKRDLFDPAIDGDALWDKLENETIGEDEFPDYNIYLESRSSDSLFGAYDRLGEVGEAFTVTDSTDKEYRIVVEVDGLDSTDILWMTYKGESVIQYGTAFSLDPGVNRLGVSVNGMKAYTAGNGETQYGWRYIGFRWVNITLPAEDDDTTSTYTCTIVSPSDGDYVLRSDDDQLYKAKIYKNGKDITMDFEDDKCLDDVCLDGYIFQVKGYNNTWNAVNVMYHYDFYDDGTIGTTENSSWAVDPDRPLEWDSQIRFVLGGKNGTTACECAVDITWCNSRSGTCDDDTSGNWLNPDD